jgi:hypothetical protein
MLTNHSGVWVPPGPLQFTTENSPVNLTHISTCKADPAEDQSTQSEPMAMSLMVSHIRK